VAAQSGVAGGHDRAVHGWLAATIVLFTVLFARLNEFTEFLYYQF
jgi:hypothetical protein